MGINTTSDIARDKAKELLTEVYKNLLIILEENNNETVFDSKYIDTVHEASLEVLKIKRKL